MVPHDGVHSSATGEILGDGARPESSERYASMFTHHPHAAYSVDTRGYFTDANDRSLEMTGLSPLILSTSGLSRLPIKLLA